MAAPSRPPLTEFASQHLAIVASAMLVLLSVLRVYYFVRFDTATALSVLSVANRTQILVSTVLNVLIFVGPLLLIFDPTRKWMTAGFTPGGPFGAYLRIGVVWMPLFPVMILAISLPVVLGALLGMVCNWMLKKRRTKKQKRNDNEHRDDEHEAFLGTVREHWGKLALVAFVGTLIVFSLNRPWLPLESMTIANSSERIVGYVIGEQAGKVLVYEPGEPVHWVDDADVTNRENCAPQESVWTAPAYALIHKDGADCSHDRETGGKKVLSAYRPGTDEA